MGVKLKGDIPKDQAVTFDDVEFDEDRMIFKLYREQMSPINQ